MKYFLPFVLLFFILPLQNLEAQPVVVTRIVLSIDDHRDFERDFLEGQSLDVLDKEYRLRDMLVLDPQYAVGLAEYDKDMKADFDFMVEKINDMGNKKSFTVEVDEDHSNKDNLIYLLGNGVGTEIMKGIYGENGAHVVILSPVSLKNNEAIIHAEGRKRNKGFAKYHIKLVGNRLEYTEIVNSIDLTKEKATAIVADQYGLGLRFAVGLAGTGFSLHPDAIKFSDYDNNVSYSAGVEYNMSLNSSSETIPNRLFLRFALNYTYFKSVLTVKEFDVSEEIESHEIVPRVGIGYRFSIMNKNSIDFGAFVGYSVNVVNPNIDLRNTIFGFSLGVTVKKVHIGVEYSPSSRDGFVANIGYNFGDFKKK